jgi:3-dehydroquinate synthase
MQEDNGNNAQDASTDRGPAQDVEAAGAGTAPTGSGMTAEAIDRIGDATTAAPAGVHFAETVIPVATPSRSYDVHVGRGILAYTGQIARTAVGGVAACIIADDTVAELYVPKVKTSMEQAGYTCTVLTFPAGEASKTPATLERLLEGMATAQLTRSDIVVALGGGVTGDIAGLAAALYLRGIPVVQVPTSLLAMVDSSVGGKTAVDLPQGKNLMGAFWQPSAVVADVDCLTTLDPQVFHDGCAEVIKHAVLADLDLFNELSTQPLTNDEADLDRLVRIVARNVEIKRDIVTADEREADQRKLLNFGHTIGHAVEAASGFSMGHGACVAVGMCCISRAASAMGWCMPEVPIVIERACAAVGLPVDTTLDRDVIVDYALHDKKRSGDTITVVTPKRIGLCEQRTLTLDEFERLVAAGCGRVPPTAR